MAFGKYPDVPLALARERHAEAGRVLASGRDPMAQRKAAKTAEKIAAENFFQTVAGLWFEHWRAKKSAQHVDATRRRMDANILPLLGARPITEIEAPELVTVVKRIEGRGAADLAKRAMQNVGQIFRYAIAHGYPLSPCTWPDTNRRCTGCHSCLPIPKRRCSRCPRRLRSSGRARCCRSRRIDRGWRRRPGPPARWRRWGRPLRT